jgi:hypothetical protein
LALIIVSTLSFKVLPLPSLRSKPGNVAVAEASTLCSSDFTESNLTRRKLWKIGIEVTKNAEIYWIVGKIWWYKTLRNHQQRQIGELADTYGKFPDKFVKLRPELASTIGKAVEKIFPSNHHNDG